MSASRRQFLFNAIEGLGFIATGTALIESLAKAGAVPVEQDIYWLLEQTDDANQNANLFFQAMFGMPKGVKVAMKKFGERFCDSTQQHLASVVIEARIEEPNSESEQQLSELGFHPFQLFEYDEKLREQLRLMNIEPPPK